MSTWVTIAILGAVLHIIIIAMNCAFGLYTFFAEPRATPANAKERILFALFGLQTTLMLKLDEWIKLSNWSWSIPVAIILMIGPLAVTQDIIKRYGSEAGFAATLVWGTLVASAISSMLVAMRRKHLTKER